VRAGKEIISMFELFSDERRQVPHSDMGPVFISGAVREVKAPTVRAQLEARAAYCDRDASLQRQQDVERAR